MKSTRLFVALLISGVLAACGGSTGSSGPGSLTVSPAAASVAAGKTQLFTVSGGSGGSTTWNASAGTITSGGLYTAPAVPPINQPVAITATQGSMSGSASATITYSNQSLNGPFVFTFSENQGAAVTNAVGVITADGNGNISGTEDVHTPTQAFSGVSVTGHYTLSANGQGTLTINGGAAGTLTLTVSLVAGAAEGILTDATNGRIGGGSLFPQTGQVSPGADLSGSFTASFGASSPVSNDNSVGVLTLSTSTIFGSNFDENNSGAYTLYTNISGSYAVGGGNRGTLTLTLNITTHHYVFYAISQDQLELMCTDASCTNTGELDRQLANGVLSGTYVFLTFGNGTGQMPDAFMAIGSVTSTSATTGSMDLNMFENNNGSYLSLTNGTTYTLGLIAPIGRGMTTLPTPSGLRDFVFNVQASGSLNLLETSSGFGNTSGFSYVTQGTSIPAGQYVMSTISQVPSSTSLGTTQGILQIGASGQVTGQEQVNTNGVITTLQVSGTIMSQSVAGTYVMTLNLGGGQTASYVLAVIVPGDMTVLRTDNSAVGAGSLIVQYQTQ